MGIYSKKNPPKGISRNIYIPLDVDELVKYIMDETGLEKSYIYTLFVCLAFDYKPLSKQYRYIDLDKKRVNQLIIIYKNNQKNN